MGTAHVVKISLRLTFVVLAVENVFYRYCLKCCPVVEDVQIFDPESTATHTLIWLMRRKLSL